MHQFGSGNAKWDLNAPPGGATPRPGCWPALSFACELIMAKPLHPSNHGPAARARGALHQRAGRFSERFSLHIHRGTAEHAGLEASVVPGQLTMINGVVSAFTVSVLS